MKFSELDGESWAALQPFMDTCLLPVTGLEGGESPADTTDKLADLQELMDEVEIPFRGRVVTYPAFHYISGGEQSSMLNAWCRRYRAAGFRFVILISADEIVGNYDLEEADLIIGPNTAIKYAQENQTDVNTRKAISNSIQKMWANSMAEGRTSR